MQEYDKKLNDFVNMLSSLTARSEDYAYLQSGRKYDKIVITSANNHLVRFFVDKSDGSVYGARSRLAPNLKWWFGTIYTTDEWIWASYHPTPKNPDNFIYMGRYGPYDRWAKK